MGLLDDAAAVEEPTGLFEDETEQDENNQHQHDGDRHLGRCRTRQSIVETSDHD